MFYKLEPFAQRLNQSYFMIADQADKNSLQDIYGSTPLRALVGFYNSLNDRQQKNFAFVANQVLDVDTAWSVLSQTAFAAKIDAEVSARTAKLAAEVERLTLKNDRLITEAEDANLELSAAMASLDAAQQAYDEERAGTERLLAEIERLQTEVDTVREFKRSLKQLLMA